MQGDSRSGMRAGARARRRADARAAHQPCLGTQALRRAHVHWREVSLLWRQARTVGRPVQGVCVRGGAMGGVTFSTAASAATSIAGKGRQIGWSAAQARWGADRAAQLGSTHLPSCAGEGPQEQPGRRLQAGAFWSTARASNFTHCNEPKTSAGSPGAGRCWLVIYSQHRGASWPADLQAACRPRHCLKVLMQRFARQTRRVAGSKLQES